MMVSRLRSGDEINDPLSSSSTANHLLGLAHSSTADAADIPQEKQRQPRKSISKSTLDVIHGVVELGEAMDVLPSAPSIQNKARLTKNTALNIKVTRDDQCPPSSSQAESSRASDSGQEKIILGNTRRLPSRRHAHGIPLRSSLKIDSNDLNSSITSTISNNTSNSTEFRSSMKTNVSFSSIEIRSYNITLGDAPTPHGPPVSLDWEYDPSATAEYDLDNYENYRTEEVPRRSRDDLLMPPNHREYLLTREAEITRGQMQLAMKEAKRVSKQREKTVKMTKLGLQPFEEVFEGARRKIFGMKKDTR